MGERGLAQALPASLVANLPGTPVTLYIHQREGETRGALKLGSGAVFMFSAEVEGNSFTARITEAEPEIEIAGTLTGELLELDLVQGEERLALDLDLITGEQGVGTTDQPLLRALGAVPDSLLTLIGLPLVSFADYHAAMVAQGGSAPGSQAEFAELSPEAVAAWRQAMARLQSGPPELLRPPAPGGSTMETLLGFDRLAVTAGLSFGTPPTTGTILVVRADPDLVGGRLNERGFDVTPMNGVPVWHHGEDGALDLAARNPGDPFDGGLGRAQRVVVLDGAVANAAFWYVSRSIVAAATDRGASLADSPAYRTLATAVSSPERLLVQATFASLTELSLAGVDPTRLPAMELDDEETRSGDDGEAPSPAGEQGALPPYELALLADMQEGPRHLAVIALAYRDEDAARQASSELGRRMLAFAQNAGATGSQLHSAEVAPALDGVFAAVAIVTLAGPEEFTAAGGGYVDWLRAIYTRQFDVLQPGPLR